MRMIEWIGQPSLLSDPSVAYGLRSDALTLAQKRLIRAAAKKRFPRVRGKTYKWLTPQQLPGLSKTYQWGPAKDSYVIPMTDNDARVVLTCIDGKEFRDVTDGIPPDPKIITSTEAGIMPVTRMDFHELERG